MKGVVFLNDREEIPDTFWANTKLNEESWSIKLNKMHGHLVEVVFLSEEVTLPEVGEKIELFRGPNVCGVLVLIDHH